MRWAGTMMRDGRSRRHKREAKGQHRATPDNALKSVLVALATDQPLDTRYRECHVKPDLLLFYCKSDADTLRLARLGSHSELFGDFGLSRFAVP